jgi:hypothetical protein
MWGCDIPESWEEEIDGITNGGDTFKFHPQAPYPCYEAKMPFPRTMQALKAMAARPCQF